MTTAAVAAHQERVARRRGGGGARMRRRAPRPAGRVPRRRVRGHARVLGATAAGAPQLRDLHHVAAGHCVGRGRAARAPAARGECGVRVRDLHVGAEGGGGAALPPLLHVRAVLPARPRLPHLPPAHRARRRARGAPRPHLCRRGLGSYRGVASTVGGGWTPSKSHQRGCRLESGQQQRHFSLLPARDKSSTSTTPSGETGRVPGAL